MASLPRYIALYALLLAAGCDAAPTFNAERGVLDLREWSPQEDGPIALDGEWEAWWGLIEPEALDPTAHTFRYWPVPESWTGMPTPDGPAGAAGAVTYRLRLKLPEGADNLQLRIGGIYSAHRLFIDGVERTGAGTVSTDLDAIVHENLRRMHGVGAEQDEVELVVQVANADYRYGGIYRSQLLGDTDDILSLYRIHTLLDAIVVTMMLGLGLYQLGLAALRPGRRLHLPFGITAIVLGIRATLSRQGQISHLLFPDLPWALGIRIEYVLTWLSAGLGLWWVSSLFTGKEPRRLTRALIGAAVAGALFASVAPIQAFTSAVIMLQVVALSSLIVVVITAFRAVAAGMEGAWLFLVSIAICVCGALWDIALTHSPAIPFNDVSTFTFAGVLGAEAIRLARAYTRSFHVIEGLGERLQRTNAQLAATNQAILRFVPTEFLEVLGHHSIREVALNDQEAREMDVLFFDIRSFTPLSEALGAERAFHFINDLLAALGPEISKHDGFVLQYLGDAIMALYYGGADQAVRGGVALLGALEDFNAHQTYADEPIRAGVGMNSGRLMMGIIGNNDWLDTGVIGDPVNLASRLEGMTKIYGTPFLISEKTADRIQDRDAVPLRELDRVRAKGKRQAVCIYEVLGALSDERRAQVEATREAFAAALELYRAGKFEEAGAAFQSCNSAAPLDLVAALYIGRCSAMAANPPRKWDGITTLTRK